MKRPDALTGRVVATLAAFFVIACGAPAAERTTKIKVIATLFPQYDFVRQIAREHAEVRLLLPPGAESHSYEPTPSDMRDIATADLFIHTGPRMEPWAERLADSAVPDGGALVVDASRGIALRREGPPHDGGDHDGHEDAEHGHEDDGHEDHTHEFDPHIWLDPTLAAAMADNIALALAERDPERADYYQANAAALRAELEELDRGFRDVVDASPRRSLVFGERFAFAYFFRRYGLREIGAYKSCAPGSEPGVKAVIEVVNRVKEDGTRYIYREASSTSRISEVVRRETGAEILLVDSLHNLPAGGEAAGYSYQRAMRDNMAAFAKGLR